MFTEHDENFISHPAVCAVGNSYQIMIPVKTKMLMSVKIGDNVYYNDANGVIMTDSLVQKFIVPMAELDSAKRYTVCYRKLIKRLAYYTQSEPECEVSYIFRPLEKTDNINICHISDCHEILNECVSAASYFGDNLDLLILNGDIASSSDTSERVIFTYIVASMITGGTLPVIISRGNHDLRGNYAEHLPEIMPGKNGASYYSVTLGCLWLIILDCGEDKDDSHPEYGHTVCCHAFRQKQSKYLQHIIDNSGAEYADDKVKYRLVVSHVPFAFNNTEVSKGESPFDTEHEIYGEWCRMLNIIKPAFMLSGHIHLCDIWRYDGVYNNKGLDCDTVIGSKPADKGETGFIGCNVTLNKNFADIRFVNDKKKTISDGKITFDY